MYAHTFPCQVLVASAHLMRNSRALQTILLTSTVGQQPMHFIKQNQDILACCASTREGGSQVIGLSMSTFFVKTIHHEKKHEGLLNVDITFFVVSISNKLKINRDILSKSYRHHSAGMHKYSATTAMYSIGHKNKPNRNTAAGDGYHFIISVSQMMLSLIAPNQAVWDWLKSIPETMEHGKRQIVSTGPKRHGTKTANREQVDVWDGREGNNMQNTLDVESSNPQLPNVIYHC